MPRRLHRYCGFLSRPIWAPHARGRPGYLSGGLDGSKAGALGESEAGL